ncbi:MAG: efflux RND transporter periplasmic adaptor subunit [Candidatus Thiodiazotropha sp. (ex Myrtea spinifera)]|nr:efflux RND transporter periplasmic adaptor subunit [Candidatus Thiodiazotropha sp. (ex Myrtea spinifera)]MCU7828152.1 efflux RND transporter periplasmic adaptor subunit [Candidatus Thiodiazotropha sp. (ex Myrtea sp. 'scaly one' KF741663)]
MKSSAYLSLGLLLGVVLWMLSGAIASVPGPDADVDSGPEAVQLMKVKVIDVTAEEITREIVVQGELEPLRKVEVRAQTTSRVVRLPVNKGERVKADTPVVELAVEDRQAQIDRAKAEVSNQKLEVAGARKLQKKGLQSETRLKAAEAALAAAEADLKMARLELDYIRIKAPFDSVLEARYVELGSHLERGDPVTLMVDESVLKAVGQVSQQSAGELSLGQRINVRLLDGREAQGVVTYISRLGDAETHSFRMEAEVPNTDGLLNAGVSAEIRIAIGQEAAHFLSPAVLSLSDKGEVGVKSVSDDGLVHFHPIKLVRTEADGVWVSGLPQQLKVITQGQGFVSTGEAVIAIPASRG